MPSCCSVASILVHLSIPSPSSNIIVSCRLLLIAKSSYVGCLRGFVSNARNSWKLQTPFQSMQDHPLPHGHVRPTTCSILRVALTASLDIPFIKDIKDRDSKHPAECGAAGGLAAQHQVHLHSGLLVHLCRDLDIGAAFMSS